MKKQNEIQIMRGMLILMVVTQHVLSIFGGEINYLLARLLYCVDVEMFFVISGMLYYSKINKYQSDGFFRFILKKTNELIIPYLFWTTLLDLIIYVGLSIPSIGTVLSGMGFRKHNIISYAINMILFRDCYIETLWFVYVLYICFFFYHILLLVLHKKVELILCCVTTISIVIQCNIDIYIVEKVFTGLIAFGSGCIIAKYRDHIENMLSTYRRVLNIIALMSFFLCFSVERSNVIPDFSFFLVAFRTMSVVVYTVTSYIIINSVIVYIPYGSTLWNLLFKYGNISYAIYLTHNPYIIYPAWIISITLLPNALIAEVVALILSYFVCLIGGTMVCMLNIGKYVIGQKELLRIGRR